MGRFLSLLGCEGRFLGKHHRDVVPDRINALAGVALESGIVREQVYGFFANRADEDGEKLLGDRHGSLQSSREDCNRQ
jgi:hypothetical protein